MALNFGDFFNMFRSDSRVDSGIGSKQKEYIVSFGASDYTTTRPQIDDLTNGNNTLTVASGTVSPKMSISLPDGADVTSCVAYGTASESWTLNRVVANSGTTQAMATAQVGTIDTSILNSIIDNKNFTYLISVLNLDTADQLNGVVITYTL